MGKHIYLCECLQFFENMCGKLADCTLVFIANFRSLTYPQVYVQPTSCIRECSLFGSLNHATRCMCGPTYTKLLFVFAGLFFFHSPGKDNSNTLESRFEFCEGFVSDIDKPSLILFKMFYLLHLLGFVLIYSYFSINNRNYFKTYPSYFCPPTLEFYRQKFSFALHQP